MQTTQHVLMVRPARFGFNEETSSSNAFQQRAETQSAKETIEQKAVEEFDGYVELLRRNGVRVTVVQDTPLPHTPDSIFPNNCFSTHADGDRRTLVIYPMCAHNRQLERTKLIKCFDQEGLMDRYRQYDLTGHEAAGKYLEGTGSMVLDRTHRVAYACLSPRTDEGVLREWADAMGYECVVFHSQDADGVAVYHTNVVMHVGSHTAVVCMESIHDGAERQRLAKSLEDGGKTIVEISLQQMGQFAGNMIELHNDRGEALLVMSDTARQSLTPMQTETLQRHARILAPCIPTIEKAGGGSARCMVAEIF